MSTVTSTSPRSVNLMALPTRFISTWRTRLASPITSAGTRSAIVDRTVMGFSLARGARMASVPCTSRRMSKGAGASSKRPDSIFEKSRMSSMIASSASPLARIVSAHSRCSGCSGESISRLVMPMTPFMGVRIS